MATKDYRTRTIFKNRKNASLNDYWIIGMDIGYSGVKGYSPNSCYAFPAYARELEGDLIDFDAEKDQILYRDNITGKMWKVGAQAQNEISISDTRDDEESLCVRVRYYDPMFHVISSVGLAMGMFSTEIASPEGKELYLQTGLPPEYCRSDGPMLREVLTGQYDFSIKLANNNWKSFKFELKAENIRIMAQPNGTLYSICVDKEGNQIAEASKYLGKKTIIFDAGFGTLDLFPVIGGVLKKGHTRTDLGMNEILKRTAENIYEKYGKEVRVPMMQKYLQDGFILSVDRKTHQTKEIKFEDILDRISKNVCSEALEYLDNLYDAMEDIDTLVVTGGTGSAWVQQIIDYYKSNRKLEIVAGSKNDELPYIFANVRGYYMSLYNELKYAQPNNIE